MAKLKTNTRLRRLVHLYEARPDLPADTLFHAGPPYRDTPPKAVLNAAALAAVIGEMAEDVSQAHQLIERGDIKLAPAQDHGIATPLAMVVSPTMWCFEVSDAEHTFHAAVGEGPPPALRFGSDNPGCITRANVWCTDAARNINPQVANLPTIERMMAAAQQSGDDCHAITASGNANFTNALGPIDKDMKAGLLENPGFILGLWMAWAGWKLKSAKASISAIGGNGIEFGWKPRGQTNWITAPATTPVGKMFHRDDAQRPLGAIGDSAIVDICGFGGQSLTSAPVLLEEWAEALPSDLQERRSKIIDPDTGIVDPGAIRRSGIAPIINLAVLDRDGARGPIGRGAYIPPLSLFTTGE